jgi:hypothetical protein
MLGVYAADLTLMLVQLPFVGSPDCQRVALGARGRTCLGCYIPGRGRGVSWWIWDLGSQCQLEIDLDTIIAYLLLLLV